MRRIVILGGGTGGTLTANRLRKRYPESDVEIVVVDRDDNHLYQPGLLFVPFGLAQPEDISRSRRRQLHSGIRFVESDIDRVDVPASRVLLAAGEQFDYDVLVIATGATLALDETQGLTGPGWGEKVHTFYTADGAQALHHSLEMFDHGQLVVDVVDMPIKCPVAPLEFCFLADWYLTERGVRQDVEITYVTPLDGAFTKPVAAAALAGLLDDKGVNLVTQFNAAEVDASAGVLSSYDDRTVDFDLAVIIPAHSGADYVGRSDGLGDAMNFVPTDKRTLQSTAAPEIFVIGDAADIPTSKAGSVTHFEGEVLVENIARFLEGQPLDAGFDGHANCFIETGFSKALLIDFNYDAEPTPGHFPADVGLPLLRESHLNHLGKLMFQWFYWHTLLPGRDIPGVGSTMPTRGKRIPSHA